MRKARKMLSLAVATAMLGGTALNASAAELRDLFDAEYYAERHADVKAALGTDPDVLFDHYVTYGVKEGRKGSQWFDVESYRSRYADLENAFGDNWEAYVNHYLTYGISEHRDGGGEVFDAISYAERYEDVKEAYGYDWDLLFLHYQVFGIKEGREAISQSIVDRWEAEARFREALEAAEQENGAIGGVLPDRTYPCTEIVQEPNGERLELVYDANGNCVKETRYDANNQLISYMISEYDANGNRVLNSGYTADGNLMLKHFHTFDSVGKLLGHTLYYYNGTGAIENYHVTTVESDTCTVEKNYMGDGTYVGKMIYTNTADGALKETESYDENDVLICKNFYNSDGIHKSYEYYTTGEVQRKTTYYSNGMIYEDITYDAAGSITRQQRYDEEGNEI